MSSTILKELVLQQQAEQPGGKIVRISVGKNTDLLLAVADRHGHTRSTVAVEAVPYSPPAVGEHGKGSSAAGGTVTGFLRRGCPYW